MSQSDAPPAGFVEVAPAERVREEGPILVRPEGRSVALFHHDGAFHAVDPLFDPPESESGPHHI